MTFAEFVAEVQERLRADMQSIRDPEGDVHPALFHYFEGETLRRMKIPKSWFSTRGSKAAMAKAIEQATRSERPRFLAWEATTYVLDAEQVEWERLRTGVATTPIRDMPGRREVVTLLALSRTESLYSEAEITRDGRNPPVFGPWTDMHDATEFQGLVIEPLMRGMQR